jgi:hypothetical protein
MLELTYASWHISRGHLVKPTDEQGTADFEILIPEQELTPDYASSVGTAFVLPAGVVSDTC